MKSEEVVVNRSSSSMLSVLLNQIRRTRERAVEKRLDKKSMCYYMFNDRNGVLHSQRLELWRSVAAVSHEWRPVGRRRVTDGCAQDRCNFSKHTLSLGCWNFHLSILIGCWEKYDKRNLLFKMAIFRYYMLLFTFKSLVIINVVSIILYSMI